MNTEESLTRVQGGWYRAQMVVDEADQVSPLVRAGTNVVLLVDPSHPHVAIPEGIGRVAVLVGALDDPVVRSAADEMCRELFGWPEPRRRSSGGSRSFP